MTGSRAFRRAQRAQTSVHSRGRVLFFGVALLLAQTSGRAQLANPLPEVHGYLVTGNYAVGSVDFPAQTAKRNVTGTYASRTTSIRGVTRSS